MKTFIRFIALFLLTISFKTYAQSDTITTDIATKYLDKTVVLKGKIVGVKSYQGSKGDMLFINLDKPYPDSEVGVVMFSDALAKLKIPVTELVDKYVFISGTLTLFKDKPNLQINDIEQLHIK